MVGSVRLAVSYTHHEVYVRRSPGYQAQQNVAVEGEILFGGSYAMTSRQAVSYTHLDVYKRQQ